MSNRTYNQLWIKTQSDVTSLLHEENQICNAKPEKDREAAFAAVSRLYVQHVRILRNLEDCYDQIVHPQKRILLRQLLDCTIGRILELKHEMVSLDNLEFSYHDETLSRMGISPSEIDLVIPKFVTRDRVEEIEYWTEQMTQAVGKMELSERESPGQHMSVDEALLILQRHERARQGRLRAKLMEDIRRQEAAAAEKGKVAEQSLSTVLAVSRIQKMWRGALARKKVRKLREEELAFIGMIPPEGYPHHYQDRLREIEAERRVVQARFEADYKEALVTVKEEMRESEGEEIEDEMQSEIRKWFFAERDDQGKFPDYPSDDEGGSVAIFHPERLVSANGNGAAAAAGGGDEADQPVAAGAAKKSEGEERKKKGGKGGSDAAAADAAEGMEGEHDEAGFVLKSTEYVRQLRSGQKMFEDIWRDKDESGNKTQRHDVDMIRAEKRSQVEDEIRLRVDALMREELDLLKIAAERDKGKKGKISKKRKGKKKASKKGKKKKDKDLTPDRTPESLFEELVLNGIIKNYPKTSLDSYLGDANFVGAILKRQRKDPNPGAGDIRRVLTEYCILPMSSTHLRENSPHIKSMLLAGPSGAGKTMLIHSICTELGATLFDLTATNIVGKYPGKSGLNMLLHLVIKVSKLMQPSIIYIDRAEKTFLKKVSKTDKSDPKRLKKDLPRLVRSLTSEDRVMLIGVSRCPWECEQKGLTQTYQKFLVIPKPDYGQRCTLWKEMITANGGLIAKYSDRFNLSGLSKVSDGYTAGSIRNAVELTLTERRVLQQSTKPLKPVEFIGALAKNEPVYLEEENAYHAWYSKTPMGKKRAKYQEGDEEENKKEKKKSKKKKR